jgi:alkylation response protein AidB-like acyl-CoA dehydrogenase
VDYTLDEQQVAVRELAAQIASRRATRERFAVLEGGGGWFDQDLWKELAAAGLVGIAVPEEQGGSGAGFVELCLLVQELARSAANVFAIEPIVLAALPISHFGTAEQQRRLLVPFCAGDLLLTSALGGGPQRCGDLVAEADGEDWRLSGEVRHVPLADAAHKVLVEAVDELGRPGLFLVDASAVGATMTPQSSVDRRPRWQLRLDRCPVVTVDVLRAPGELSEDDERWIRDRAVAARCVAQVGSSEAALRMTADYVSERKQFGRPIGTFQAVAQRIADAYIDVTGVRLTAWRAAWLLGEDAPDAQALALAAWWAADAPGRVAEAAMHLHGGLGVDLDYALHRHYLAVRQGELSLGGPSSRLQALGDILAVA